MPTERIDIQERLVGARQFQQDAAASSAAISGMGLSTDRYAKSTLLARSRTFLWNQALFTMRRLLYANTLGVIALGGEAVKLGVSYDMAMQQGQIAFSRFLGSASAAHKELVDLYQFTAKTPFQFKDITNAVRILLGFNVPLGQANQTIHNIVDVLAAMGNTSPGVLRRVTLALGHMQSLGYITGQTIQQLARDNIPAVGEALQKYLGVTDLHNIARLRIPAALALDAINKYIQTNPKYHGMAQRIAEGSLGGLLTTFKDYVAQFTGALDAGILGSMQRFIQRANPVLQTMSRAAALRGPMAGIKAFDEGVGAGGKFYHTVLLIVTILKDMWSVFHNLVWPELKLWISVVFPMVAAAALLFAGALHLLANYGFVLIPLLKLLTLLYIAHKVAAIAMFWWDFRLAAAWGAGALAAKAEALAMKYLDIWAARTIIWEKALMVATWLQVAAMWAWEAILGLLAPTIAVVTEEMLALDVAMDANPIGLIILAIAALVIGIIALIKYWRQVANAMEYVWGKMKAMASWASHHKTDVLKAIFPEVGAANWLAKKIGLPHFATGGIMHVAGAALVGENGPEIAYMPGGTRVEPLDRSPTDLMSFSELVIPVSLYLDRAGRKLLATNTVRATQNKGARG